MAFKLVLASVLLSAALVSGDWSGSGQLTCYGHVDVTASFDAGANNAGPGSVQCVPREWDIDTGLGPEAMFFKSGGQEFEIWAWDYHPSWGFGDVMPTATCEGDLWYKTEDMGAGFCTPNLDKNWSGCGIVQCSGDIYCNGC
eukprot:TRINITY_DN10055_c0_g1_i1.p1 TRINITY_DN10055_c0_g1~~TRINITY_DN10055_c0_g1_i1.p1  ORF type:complete len:142 (-),score=35.27 TRINITY_DN10055_c0_g1_i1:27-452(-)